MGNVECYKSPHCHQAESQWLNICQHTSGLLSSVRVGEPSSSLQSVAAHFSGNWTATFLIPLQVAFCLMGVDLPSKSCRSLLLRDTKFHRPGLESRKERLGFGQK